MNQDLKIDTWIIYGILRFRQTKPTFWWMISFRSTKSRTT